ncbi:MAG: hypothetical protein ACRDSH_15800, partial [Pseudonocardiaceae bacterium]
MAQRNRERRAAAAARRREHRRTFAGPRIVGPATAGWGTAGGTTTGTSTSATSGPGARAKPSAETISTVLLSAAREHWAGDAESGVRIGAIVAGRCGDQPDIVTAALRCAVLPLVSAAWERGWS